MYVGKYNFSHRPDKATQCGVSKSLSVLKLHLFGFQYSSVHYIIVEVYFDWNCRHFSDIFDFVLGPFLPCIEIWNDICP